MGMLWGRYFVLLVLLTILLPLAGCAGGGGGSSQSPAGNQAVSAPTFLPAEGTYGSVQLVTIQSATAGATIFYTTDGSVPSTLSTAYTAPVPVSANQTVKALAVKTGMTDSTTASANYAITAIMSYPASAGGSLIASSWVTPGGSDADMYAYKDFTLVSDQTINEVDWRGGYIHNAAGGAVTNFTITFFDSIAGGSQPNVGARPDAGSETPLIKYDTGGNANETAVAGTNLYDYRFVLPTPFQAQAGKKYWIRIEGFQATASDWGIAAATGGNGRYYRFSTGTAQFLFVNGGDTAFTLK